MSESFWMAFLDLIKTLGLAFIGYMAGKFQAQASIHKNGKIKQAQDLKKDSP